MAAQARTLYSAGMNKKHSVQYTVRFVPQRLDRALRDRARQEGKSLNSLTIQTLERGLGLSDEKVLYHDLDELAGTWVADKEFDQALAAMDRVDPDLWK